MSNNQSQRHAIFINKAFQGRFILGVLLLILLSAFCSSLIIYWIAGSDLQAHSQTAHINIMKTLKHLGISIFFANLVALLIAGSLAVFVMLYSSHKIAGPLYRLEKLCEQIGNDQFDSITPLREHDQLQELGKAFAEMASNLRNRKENRLMLITTLSSHLAKIQNDPVISNQYSEQLKKINHTLTQLQE